ncbi:hypothetical protein, partial [Kistimonas scapharcae]|uniref:hypothetical protein n=1 Tax=Kistimonas scapharcae TaxID=1036133 RepID=UPI0031E75E41
MGYEIYVYDGSKYREYQHAEPDGAIYGTPANIESLHTNYGFADLRELAATITSCVGNDDLMVGIVEQGTFLTLDEIDDCFTDDNDFSDAVAEALFKKQKPKQEPRPEDVSPLHYYLTNRIITWATKDDNCVGDKFGIGEDDLVMQLWDYAVAIEKAWIEFEKDRGAPGVFAYDVADGTAPRMMIEMLEHPHALEDELPSLDEWQKNVNILVDKYMDCQEPKNDQSV